MNKIVIDSERCKGCYLCIEACPKNIIVAGDQLNGGGYYPAKQNGSEDCTACTLCGRICPDAAIDVYREVEN